MVSRWFMSVTMTVTSIYGEAAAGVIEDGAEVGAARAGRAAGSLTTTLQPEVRS
jgi:hypothetical protein